MHWKVPTYRPLTQLRPGLRFSVLLQEGHTMHRALDPFTCKEIKEHLWVSLHMEGQKGGFKVPPRMERFDASRQKGGAKVFSQTGECNAIKLSTFKKALPLFGEGFRSVLPRMRPDHDHQSLFSPLGRCPKESLPAVGWRGHLSTDHYQPSTVDYGLTDRLLISRYRSLITGHRLTDHWLTDHGSTDHWLTDQLITDTPATINCRLWTVVYGLWSMD